MKPALIIACGLLNFLATSAVLGQSSFWFNNYNLPTVNAPVFDAQGIPLEGPNYVAALWGGATSNSLTPALAYYSRQQVIIPFRSGSSAGLFRDTYIGRDPADHPTVLGVAPYSGLAWLEVRAWDTRLGATYEEVAALGIGGYGESPLFSAHGSDPRDLLMVPAPLTGLQSFGLLPVIPEPCIWALLTFGGAAVWWKFWQQRKRHR